jgi:hypothetical protein
MGWRSALLKPAALWTARSVRRAGERAVESQRETLAALVARAKDTAFGREHGFGKIGDAGDFRHAVRLRDYEDYRPYIDRMKAGEADVTWPGRPAYFAITSGTTSATKHVPLTADIMPSQYGTTRKALLNHYGRTGRGSWADGIAVVLVGSPDLQDSFSGIPAGLLSAIVSKHTPSWFRDRSLPGEEVIRIPNWEDKMAALVAESRDRDIRLVGGSPAWMLMYFEYLLDATGRGAVLDVFPNLSTFVHGGVDFSLYRAAIEKQIGGRIDTIDIYPATEGFIAFQAGEPGEGMMLNLESGIYFEFVPVEKADDPGAVRLGLDQVEAGVDYAIAISTNSGFFAYLIGDIVRFTSVRPPQILVTGRTRHMLSVANERMYAKEVDDAILAACTATGARIVEFTVAPKALPEGGGRPYHDWYVEFDGDVPDRDRFIAAVDDHIRSVNYNYNAFRHAGVVAAPRLHPVRPAAFRDYMKSIGKMGGQYKVPRLQNSRAVVEALDADVI